MFCMYGAAAKSRRSALQWKDEGVMQGCAVPVLML